MHIFISLILSALLTGFFLWIGMKVVAFLERGTDLFSLYIGKGGRIIF